MKYELSVKTGFFTSEPCSLTISKGLLTLSWACATRDEIRLAEESIMGIVIKKRNLLEIEITTNEKTLSDFSPVIMTLNNCLTF